MSLISYPSIGERSQRMKVIKEMNDPQGHSPLGGGQVERFMLCAGTMRLSYGVPDEENEFTTPGLAAHALGAVCLSDGRDAWEFIGEPWELSGEDANGSGTVDKEMADAIAVYTGAIRTTHNLGTRILDGEPACAIERPFHCPTIHKLFWGTADFVWLDRANRTLHVWDFKYGAGIIIEVIENGQLMYYACGILEALALWAYVDKIILHIVQPRGFHPDGPVLEWAISVDDLQVWLETILIPAMDNAMVSTETASGQHCRFCPARARACPQLMKDFDELEELVMEMTKAGSAKKLTNKQVGRILDLHDVLKIAGKAALKTAFGRMSAGKKIPNRKLVKAKSNREWKDDAAFALGKEFGARSLTTPELKHAGERFRGLKFEIVPQRK